MSTMQPLRSPGGGESGGLAVSAEDTFVRLWEGWGELPQPGSGRAQNQAVVSRVLLWLRGVSPRHQAGFPCSFVETGLFSFDFFFFPFCIFCVITSKYSEFNALGNTVAFEAWNGRGPWDLW